MAPLMAVKVQNGQQDNFSLRAAEPARRMNRDFQIRFTAILLALLTTAGIILAWINFQKEREFQVPYDGAWWVERNGSLLAEHVEPDGPAYRAGVRVGDQLTAVDEHKVSSSAMQMRELYRVGAWSRAKYSLVRDSVPVDVTVIPAPARKQRAISRRAVSRLTRRSSASGKRPTPRVQM